jgi:DNA-binding ferritin-like protein
MTGRRWAAAHPGQSFYGTKLETGDIDQFLSIVAERVRTYDAKTAARMMNAWDAVEWIDRSQSQVHKRDVLPVLHTHLERCKEHLSALKEMLEEFKTDKVDNTTAALLQKSVERMEEYTDWVKGGMQLLGAEQFYREHLDDPISWYSLTGEGTPED